MKTPVFSAELIAAFNSGDTNVFARIYRELYPAIYHFTNKIVNDADQAEDIAAETFVKVWNKRGNLVSYDNIKAFAYVVARNAAFNYTQTVNRRNLSHKEILYLSSEEDQFVDFEVVNADVIGELHHQIEQLPPQCGLVFKNMFFHGKNSSQVAEEMGITRKTVLNQKLKAIALLRIALYKKGLIPALLLLTQMILHHPNEY